MDYCQLALWTLSTHMFLQLEHSYIRSLQHVLHINRQVNSSKPVCIHKNHLISKHIEPKLLLRPLTIAFSFHRINSVKIEIFFKSMLLSSSLSLSKSFNYFSEIRWISDYENYNWRCNGENVKVRTKRNESPTVLPLSDYKYGYSFAITNWSSFLRTFYQMEMRWKMVFKRFSLVSSSQIFWHAFVMSTRQYWNRHDDITSTFDTWKHWLIGNVHESLLWTIFFVE